MKLLHDDERPWSDFTLYWSDKYLGFFFPLHNGWQSHPKILFVRHGWEYYKPAMLYGNKTTGQSRWFGLGTILVPAKLVHLWRMRRASYRKAFKHDKPKPSLDVEGKV